MDLPRRPQRAARDKALARSLSREAGESRKSRPKSETEAPGKSWECSQCTLENPFQNQSCEACGFKPGRPRKLGRKLLEAESVPPPEPPGTLRPPSQCNPLEVAPTQPYSQEPLLGADENSCCSGDAVIDREGVLPADARMEGGGNKEGTGAAPGPQEELWVQGTMFPSRPTSFRRVAAFSPGKISALSLGVWSGAPVVAICQREPWVVAVWSMDSSGSYLAAIWEDPGRCVVGSHIVGAMHRDASSSILLHMPPIPFFHVLRGWPRQRSGDYACG